MVHRNNKMRYERLICALFEVIFSFCCGFCPLFSSLSVAYFVLCQIIVSSFGCHPGKLLITVNRPVFCFLFFCLSAKRRTFVFLFYRQSLSVWVFFFFVHLPLNWHLANFSCSRPFFTASILSGDRGQAPTIY